MTTKTHEVCENEKRIITLENKVEYKEDKIEQLIQDNKDINNNLNKLAITVTELTQTIKLRNEDSKKIDNVENDVIRINSKVNTIMWGIPVVCTIISLIVNAIT